MNQRRKTLLTHPARREGDLLRVDPRVPELVAAYAETLMRNAGVPANRDGLRAALDDDYEDAIAHDASWLREHAHQALRTIMRAPPELQEAIRHVWTNGFHAGARHESITVNARYLPSVEAQKRIRAAAQLGGLARRKLTRELYEQMRARKPKNKKQLAGWLDVTPQALRDFEKKHKLGGKVA